MSVTVDQKPLATEELGLRTVGQVLSHLRRANRLVVNVLIDGEEPDVDTLGVVRQSLVSGHTLFIETADPREMALEVLDEVCQQLRDAEATRAEVTDLLRRNNNVKAMEKLSGCFSTWQHAQESVLKTARLLRIDLDTIRVGDRSLTNIIEEFTAQLRQIRTALENRDFVSLSDLLTYEMTETNGQWRAALTALGIAISQP